MAKKGGGTKLKRQVAPAFWQIKRKEKRFVVSVNPGPHPKHSAYSLALVLRDILGLTETLHEVEKIMNKNYVMVDGRSVQDPRRAVGLMDVLEVVPSNQAYRLVPIAGEQLSPISIGNDEKRLKLVKITSKITIKAGRKQYGFHDGKTMLVDGNYNVGDTCLIEIPKLKMKDYIPLDKGVLAIVTKGENVGQIGKIEEIRDGLFSLPKRALISLGNRTVELPANLIMAIGKSDSALIKVSE